MLLLTLSGFLLEAVGLGFAAVGLWRTWNANATKPFPPKAIRLIGRWIRAHVLGRKPAATTLELRDELPAIQDTLVLVSYSPLRDDMTIDDKIETIQRNAVRALSDLSTVQSEIAAERKERERTRTAFEHGLANAQQSMESFSRELVVDGVPMAVYGLGAAALGLILQAIAAVCAT